MMYCLKEGGVNETLLSSTLVILTHAVPALTLFE